MEHAITPEDPGQAGAQPSAPGGRTPGGRGFVEARGRLGAFLSTEAGPGELWFWPLEIARGLRIRTPRVLGSEVFEPGPAKLRIAHRCHTGTLESLAYVPEGERAFLWSFRWKPSAGTPRALELEVEFTAVLRPQWPAGLGGAFARMEGDLLVLGEELGRFAVALGSPGFSVQGSNLDHALPTDPVVLRTELTATSTEASMDSVLVFAGAQMNPMPLDEAARRGDAGAAEGLARTQPVTDAALALHQRLLANWTGELSADEARWRARRSHLARLVTGDEARDLAFLHAREAIQRAEVEVHGLGRGLVAGLAPGQGSSRPGFGWFFDGDAMIAGRALVLCGAREEARAVLDFAASHQREDGKMLHELSLSAELCNWFEDYPYAWYKANNTPAFLIDLGHHLRITGDLEFARHHLPACRSALAWCTRVRTSDGLLSNRLAGLCAVEAGPLQGRIEAEIYLQGLWLAALESAMHLGETLGDKGLATGAKESLGTATEAFEGFWDEDHGAYAFAHLRDGTRFHEVSAFTAYPFARGFGSEERVRRTCTHLNHPRLACDWGVRFFPTDGEVYDPGHYNTGSVFPYISLYPVLALYRVGFAPAAWQLLAGLYALDGFESEGFVPEHLVGDRCETPVRGVPHQIFSSSALIQGLVEGTFGYAPRAERNELHWGPRLPASWTASRLERLGFGDRGLDLEVEVERQADSRILRFRIEDPSARPFSLLFAPELPPHTVLRNCSVNGQATTTVRIETRRVGTMVSLPALEVEGKAEIELEVVLGPEPQAAVPDLAWGSTPKDLRLVSCTVEDWGVRWHLAGPPGTRHTLGLECDRSLALRGADRLADGRMAVRLPEAPGAAWVEHTLEFHLDSTSPQEPQEPQEPLDG